MQKYVDSLKLYSIVICVYMQHTNHTNFKGGYLKIPPLGPVRPDQINLLLHGFVWSSFCLF